MQTSNRIRILLSDSHRNVREQLAARIKREPVFDLVGETESGADTLAAALEQHPDLLLIDPQTGTADEWAMLRETLTRLPSLSVVVLMAVADTATKLELRKMGVRAILDKGIESHELIRVLKQAAMVA